MTHTLEQVLDNLALSFTETIPFHQLIGLRVNHLDANNIEMELPMSDKLIGNYTMGILHGGVTASVLDVTGGLLGMAHDMGRMVNEEGTVNEEHLMRLAKFATIDMRVDYLRPGRGEKFIATAKVIRAGSKLVVCRMEMKNEKEQLIATGTASYIIGEAG